MSKLDDLMVKYQEALSSTLGVRNVDTNLLRAVAKGLGPSIYNADAATVSCSDKEELNRVKANFLIKKLGLKDGPALDQAIEEVCQQYGSSRNKYRAVFYYMLVKKFNKESVYM